MRLQDFSGDAPLGLKPGDNVTLSDIVYVIFWITPGTEQFGNQLDFRCFCQGELLDTLCRIQYNDLPF